MGFRISIQYPSGSFMKASPFIFPTKIPNEFNILVSIHNSLTEKLRGYNTQQSEQMVNISNKPSSS